MEQLHWKMRSESRNFIEIYNISRGQKGFFLGSHQNRNK